MRATWKGRIKVAELTCPVSLYAAATSSSRVAFHILNRKTGNRVRREYYDEETEKPVGPEDQVKGYEVESGDYVVFTDEELAAAIPAADKTISVSAFIPCKDINTVYFDRPYFLAPSDKNFSDTFALLREGMATQKVAALGEALLFRRVRPLLIRAHGQGMIAHTLNFDYEVRAASEVFHDLPEIKIGGEVLDLAQHIIQTKAGKFDPWSFDDRYDQALAELVRAKQEGRTIKHKTPTKPSKVTSLLDALRESAKAVGKPSKGSSGASKARKAS
jgi:DNA end-binding protein Ku